MWEYCSYSLYYTARNGQCKVYYPVQKSRSSIMNPSKTSTCCSNLFHIITVRHTHFRSTRKNTTSFSAYEADRNILFIQQVVQCFHIFLCPFNNYIIFFLQLLLSFFHSSINPFSPISLLIPSAQVSLGLPRFLLPGGRHFITSFGSLPMQFDTGVSRARVRKP